jgi:Raf kinase inhibitor-like YbhB/YbcL family protein
LVIAKLNGEDAVKRGIGALFVASGLVFSVCVNPAAKAADPFVLRSPTLEDNGKLAIKNAGNNKANPNCVGENISPPFKWSNPPDGTKSFALLMFDPEGRAGLGVSHWVAYGIPASVTEFAEGEVSKASDKYVGGKSTPGLATYFGPCTPPGDWHHYTFTLIATDLDPKALQPGLTREELMAALNGHAKAAAGLIGRFTHP